MSLKDSDASLTQLTMFEIDPNHKPVVHPPCRVPVTLRSKSKRWARTTVYDRKRPWTYGQHGEVTKPATDMRSQQSNKSWTLFYKDNWRGCYSNVQCQSILSPWRRFWQVQLDHKSSTFNTPFGRCMFKRLPLGISSAQDVFQATMSEMFEDIDGVEVIVYDLLIWGAKHDERLGSPRTT